MVSKILLLWAVLLVVLAGAVRAEELIPDPDVGPKISGCRQAVTLTGKIAYAKEVGGYFFQTGQAGDKVILNQNYDTLKKLARRNKAVKMGGRVNPLDLEARYLFIETLDGKPYYGDKAPLVIKPKKSNPFF
ncbi:hypothetical protein [Desulfobacca acetoxidans]|uniref:Uncharacterized protein n=1 Tax=Desulfobacca acetoxidans (strain ATCC 700848 / DSM 11109 / ASRB2) TaxID=880072 RepID=F2NEV7_DESAR|nr:hypothetical protein [Desulfobacca acetoxidans]AEB08297.1 hypothetical protein Desac_0409 [Desulfobacca acetoxidans DSM 11109]